ncbi:MAG: glycogen-binding domain-containing protein [Kiritimatiellae bacterium]|nr:glycogen-binding domain-containing protein [Kiritimatiellia bacterium]
MNRAKRIVKKKAQLREEHAACEDKQSRQKEIYFEICAAPACSVCMAGSFNNWQPQELKDDGTGKYTALVTLPAGRHEYKFIINDAWLHDSGNPTMVVNAFGSLNSVIEV